jgi:cytochrome c556
MRLAVGFRRAGLIAVAVAGLAGLAQAQAPSPAQIIADRKAGYKHMGDNFDAIKKAVDSGASPKTVVPQIQEVVDFAKTIPSRFPDGTQTGGETHALPAIWTDRAGFDKDAAAFQEQSAKLLTVAESDDKDAFAAQFRATGGTCGACHRTYRARLN